MSRGFAWLLVALSGAGAIALLLNVTGRPTMKPAVPLTAEPGRVREYDVVAEYPHDAQALTQGLVYARGFLYESTGGAGRSSIRKVELTTGSVIRERVLDDGALGEGLTVWRGELIQLTRQPNGPMVRFWPPEDFFSLFTRSPNRDYGYRYDSQTLETRSRFKYGGDGWGLTQDGRQFIQSDGTSMLRFLNAETMKWQAQIGVVETGEGIRWLNELESTDGYVFANLWQQDQIAIIQLDSGEVKGWIDLSDLKRKMTPQPQDDKSLGAYGKAVANGIAWDAEGRRLFVTGKNWPRLFEIKLRE